RRSLLGRIFFDGIEVAREKDGKDDAVDNAAALRQSVEALKAGGALFIMPEGTSDLGPRHLPFKKGAARILAAALAEGVRPTVVPQGIHYEQAWAWQSDAEIVAGPSLDLDLPPGTEGPAAVALLHKRIVAALEALAVQAPDADAFARRERTAYAATLGTGRSYFAAHKALEPGLPEAEGAQPDFDAPVADAGLFLHQGVPLVPIRHAWAYALYALILAPLVVAACLLNLPPLLVAREAGRRFADAPNTITLWRLLTGAPALALWAGGLLAWAAAAGNLPAWGTYAALSWLGLRSIYRLKKLAVSLGNLVRFPSLRPRLLALHQRLDAALRAKGV
ncbi:MAG: 1-acyl-sn-glycerol-3-phosphate acyltransferase, partial [Actinomycetota bacterium]